MHLSGSDWAVITSHHKWTVLRRLHDPPILLYSQIELQKDNTRIFRALVAMTLAVGNQITIPLPPNNLTSIAGDANVIQNEGEGPDSLQTHESQSEDDKHDGNIELQRDLEVRPLALSITIQLIICIQIRLLDNSPVFLKAVKGTGKCSFAGQHPIRVRLVSELGRGATAIVFGAADDRIKDDQKHDASSRPTHAIKFVAKDSSQAEEKISRLRNEFEAYIRIEQHRAAGFGGESIPRCYGLFESDRSVVLLTEYAGKSLSSFDDIPPEARYVFFRSSFILYQCSLTNNFKIVAAQSCEVLTFGGSPT